MDQEECFTILCIDDNQTILTLRKLVLEVKGYRVLVCSDPKCSLKILREENVDLVLLDFQMPEMDGAQCAEKIRQIKPEVPIIFCIAVPDDIPDENPFNAKKHIKDEGPEALLEKVAAVFLARRMPAYQISGSGAVRIMVGKTIIIIQTHRDKFEDAKIWIAAMQMKLEKRVLKVQQIVGDVCPEKANTMRSGQCITNW